MAEWGLERRTTSLGNESFRASVYLNGKRRRGSWTPSVEEAVADRDRLDAARELQHRPVEVNADDLDATPIVYFIQAGMCGPIKIGITTGDPSSRLRSLQTSHYETLRVRGITYGDVSVERRLHEDLREFHIRGEWFWPAERVLEVIDKLCAEYAMTEEEGEAELDRMNLGLVRAHLYSISGGMIRPTDSQGLRPVVAMGRPTQRPTETSDIPISREKA